MMDVPASPPPSTPVAQPSTFQPPPSAYAQSPGAAQAPVSVQMPAPPVAAEPTARPARKSKTGLIIGLVAVFLVLVIAAAAALFFTVIRPRMLANANTNTESNGNTGTDQNANANTSPNANGNESANANTNTGIDTNIMNAPPVTPPPNSAKFINSSGSLDGALVEHYVDFSFYYPQAWKKDPNSGVRGASNFVKVERIQPPNYTLENAAISWYASKGSYDTDKDLFPKLVEKLSSSYSQNTQRFPAYRKVSEGETMVGPYKGYEFRFESSISDAGSGGKLWGRIIFLPPVSTDETDGLVMYLLATSLATELTSADDVGVKGELPMILETFRFGKEQ
jgi:hypothetical protein